MILIPSAAVLSIYGRRTDVMKCELGRPKIVQCGGRKTSPRSRNQCCYLFPILDVAVRWIYSHVYGLHGHVIFSP